MGHKSLITKLLLIIILMLPTVTYADTQSKYPTGDYLFQWTTIYPASPTTHWDKVDDSSESPDDDSTYVQDSTLVHIDSYSYTAFSIPSGATSITVTVSTRAKQINSSAGYVERIVVGGAGYTGASSHYPTTDYGNYSSVWTQNPKTSANWTVDDINGIGSNALQYFGILNGGNLGVRVTQCYITVSYTTGSSLINTRDKRASIIMMPFMFGRPLPTPGQ